MELADTDGRWRDLYKLAGVATIISEIVILMGIVTYPIWPYAPGVKSAADILVTLRQDPLGGAVSLDLFLFIGNLFGIFVFLALYVALKPVNESYALAALVVGLVGVVLLVPARPILELFALSGQYASAATDATRAQILASAGALLAAFDGSGWFMNTLLGALSFLASSLLMLRSPLFSKPAAWAGIITNLLVCGFFLPVAGKLLLFVSLPGYMVWYFLLARRFFQLARGR